MPYVAAELEASMPDPCVQFQEHAWKKDVCVNCLRSRANHAGDNVKVPAPSKRHSRSNADVTKPAIKTTKPEIKAIKPNVTKAGTKTNGKETKDVNVEKGELERKDSVTDDAVKNSLAKLMTKQSPTPKHERLQRNGSMAGSSVYMRGFPDLAKLKSNPGSPIKTPLGGGTTPRSPSMDSSTSTTSTVSTTSNLSTAGGDRRPSMDTFKSGDAGATDKVTSKIEKSREKRAEKLKGGTKGKGSRPHVPPPCAPPPCPPDGGPEPKKPGAAAGRSKSSGGHYYHQYDLTAKGMSGTPASTLEKAKKLKAKKEAADKLLQEVHVAMPYTVVDVSKCVPKEDAAPKLPNCPAPDKMDSLRSNASAKKYNGKLDKNLSQLHGTKPKEPTKNIEEVLPAAEEFGFIDEGSPNLPVILHDEQKKLQRDSKSPSPPRKVPIMIQPGKPTSNTYEPIEGEDLLNGDTGRSASGRSVTFTEEAPESSPAPKRQDKARKSGGKSFFKKLLGFGSKENNVDETGSVENSVDDELSSSQDNLDIDTSSGAKAKKKPSSEKSVTFGFTSAWTEAIKRTTPERELASSPETPSPVTTGGHLIPPLSPNLDVNLATGPKRQPALSKELEIDTSFIDKVMKDSTGASITLSPGARGGPVSPRGPTSPKGPISPSGRVSKPVKHPSVPPPPAPVSPQPKLNSEQPKSSQSKSAQKRVSINVNVLKASDRKSALLESAEKPRPKTVNIETEHSKAILGDALEEPVYEIGNLQDALSSLLEGFGKSIDEGEKRDILSSPEQKRPREPSNDIISSVMASTVSNVMTDSVMSTSSVTSGSDTLTRRRSRSKADGQRTSMYTHKSYHSIFTMYLYPVVYIF